MHLLETISKRERGEEEERERYIEIRAHLPDTFSGDLFIMRSRCFRAIKSACNQVGPLVGACYDRVINVPRKSYRVASFEFVIFFRMGNLPLLRSSSLASRPRYSASLFLFLFRPLPFSLSHHPIIKKGPKSRAV